MEKKVKASPILSLIEFGDRIYAKIDDVSNVIGWAIIVAIWMILAGASVILNAPRDILGGLFVVGICLGILSPYIIYKGILVNRLMNSWAEDFIFFSYALKFEIFPPMGRSPQEKVWNRLSNIFIDLKPRIEKKPKVVQFNASLQGKRSTHHFDVYVDLSKWELGDIFVKRFEKKDAVTEEDLQTLKENILDVLKKKKHDVYEITVLSISSFTPSAIEYVKNEDNLIEDVGFNLIIEKPNGYEVIWAEG